MIFTFMNNEIFVIAHFYIFNIEVFRFYHHQFNQMECNRDNGDFPEFHHNASHLFSFHLFNPIILNQRFQYFINNF